LVLLGCEHEESLGQRSAFEAVTTLVAAYWVEKQRPGRDQGVTYSEFYSDFQSCSLVACIKREERGEEQSRQRKTRGATASELQKHHDHHSSRMLVVSSKPMSHADVILTHD
jgi:hypothetical protein